MAPDANAIVPNDGQNQPANLLMVGPGLARIAISSTWRVVQWSATTSVGVGTQAVRALATGQGPVWVVQEVASGLRNLALQGLGLDPDVIPPARTPAIITLASSLTNGARNGSSPLTPEQLRAKGTDLLNRSADVTHEVDVHPAYERILTDLSPDEARILRFLAVDGAQPSVDVRTGRPLGIGSEMIESGMTMIGLQAGVRRSERTKPYLNNLYRLGLVWFSHEPLANPSRYQVLEVQPDVVEALKRAGRTGKTVRRRIELTAFGEDFCRVCFPLGVDQ
jgi:hypothetical protein